MHGTHHRPDDNVYTGAGKEGSAAWTLDLEWMVASDVIRRDGVGEELIQLCSLATTVSYYLYTQIS